MNIEKEFEKIAFDTVNGASFITEKTVEISKKALLENLPYEKIKKNLSLIKTRQNMMASVFNLIKEIETLLDANENREKIIEFCDSFSEKSARFSKEAAKNASEYLPENCTILTHSFSSLVFNALVSAKESGKRLKVICTKSEPKNEGEKLCEELKKNGVDSLLVTDAQAGFSIKEADLFLIGADGINEEFLIHKIGTLPIALAAKHFGKKVVSVATKLKFWEKGHEIEKEIPKNPDEISSKKNCEKINFYFDLTPLTLIDKIITEDEFQKI